MNIKLIKNHLSNGYKVKRRHWKNGKYLEMRMSEIYIIDDGLLKKYKFTKTDLKANNWLQIKS